VSAYPSTEDDHEHALIMTTLLRNLSSLATWTTLLTRRRTRRRWRAGVRGTADSLSQSVLRPYLSVYALSSTSESQAETVHETSSACPGAELDGGWVKAPGRARGVSSALVACLRRSPWTDPPRLVASRDISAPICGSHINL
jgi:hypothetical protein